MDKNFDHQTSQSRVNVGILTMGLYHPLGGDTNFKYKLLCFLTPNKKKFKEKGTSF
jgi:hypothetical protein